MKIKWVIESGKVEQENWNSIVAYLNETSRENVRVTYRPFTNNKVQTDFGDEDCVVGFGCLGLVRSIGQNNRWVPGVWCDWEKLKCSYYLSHWGKYSIHQDYGFYPLSEIWRRKDWLFEKYASNIYHGHPHIFVRPDDNFKSFNAELVAAEHWDSFRSQVECYQPSDHILCMVSSPVMIQSEWRLVIADGKVITGSQYRKTLNNSLSAEIEPGYDPLAAEFAEHIIAESGWQPHPVYVMDICKSGNGYKLVEIGSINSAGLYLCDIPTVVDTISSIAEREWKDIYEYD